MAGAEVLRQHPNQGKGAALMAGFEYCLLYTSDAADDLLCVDLGGRRIIKKKNNLTYVGQTMIGLELFTSQVSPKYIIRRLNDN